ncbi:cation:dicarboxylate symporter family transporter [Massilia frigida]|nr:cation:dicarboxylase symporter family transporter [Massilia frigida]
MNLLTHVRRHPAALLSTLLLGLWVGVLWPGGAGLFAALSSIYLALLQAFALPYIVLAVYFGLQRMPAAGAHWRRWLAVTVPALLAMPLCALGGVLLAGVSAAGAGLELPQQMALGRMALGAGDAAISLYGAEPPLVARSQIAQFVPRNLYAVLAAGTLPSVLIGVLLFGAAVATQRRDVTNHLSIILEAVYRALEAAIGSINAGLPLIAFVLAAAASAGAGDGSTGLLIGFLATWLAAVLLASLVAGALICWRLKAHPWTVMTALREPVTVCLFTPAGAAALPEFIAALSVRLGLRRGASELVMPVAPVFVRCGEALFFAVLAVFIANLYGRPLTLSESAMVVLLACWSALCSIGTVGVKTVLWSGVLQASLGLPMEALLPALAAVEVLCAGPRNLVTYLSAAVLVALVSTARPLQTAVVHAAQPAPVWPMVLTRRQAWLGASLLTAALLAFFCAGVGFGLRKMLMPGL